MAEKPAYVLDTSAILALRGNEAGADRVEEILRAASARHASVRVSFMTRMEMLYRITADEGAEAAAQAVRLLDAVPVEWVSCELDILRAAAELKAGGGLSVADAWIAATALVRGGMLVHKDPEFGRAPHVRQERLAGR
jgi:predicted nucleic acid-binding protein